MEIWKMKAINIYIYIHILVKKFQEYILEAFSGRVNARSTKKIQLEILNIIEYVS
jgi:hypothetical protein